MSTRKGCAGRIRSEIERRIKTSRSQVNGRLDRDSKSVALDTLAYAEQLRALAEVVGFA